MLQVRPYESADRAFVMGLAPRLAIGRPEWRDGALWDAAVQGWLAGSIAKHPGETMVFIAEDDGGERLGFATVTHARHFTGERQASIGELAISERAEGRGVGAALVQACARWAREQGYRTLALATGAANDRALGFYRHLGFRDEDITLVKLL
jgi:GNAT superfamily N-acetyltransferase